VRERRPPDRYSTAAFVAARYAEMQGHGFYGYDVQCPRYPIHAMYVDTQDGAARVYEQIMTMAMDDGIHEHQAEAKASQAADEYKELAPEAQQAAMIAMDHAMLAHEYGAGSPQAGMARDMYAASMLHAARAGVLIPALDPLFPALDDGSVTASWNDIFAERHQARIFCVGPANSLNLMLAAKSKSSPDIYSEREMKGPEWDEPKGTEMNKLQKLEAFEWVAKDDPRVQYLKCIDCCWAGRAKRDADGKILCLSARCCLRGDLQARICNITDNEAHSPVVLNQSLACCEAVSALRGQKCVSCDVVGAYLQGEQKEHERILMRPPRDVRRYDERGVELLMWSIHPLYGGRVAGAIWNRTFNDFVTAAPPKGLGDHRCPQEPAVYSREVKDGGRITKPLYVDDFKVYYDTDETTEKAAKEDIEKLAKRFELKVGEFDAKETYF